MPASFVSVKEAPFSASGDGQTDDTQAIKNALLACLARQGNDRRGAVLYFPAGTYCISSKLDLQSLYEEAGTLPDGQFTPDSMVPLSIKGDGKSQSRLKWINGAESAGLRLIGSHQGVGLTTTLSVSGIGLLSEFKSADTALEVTWVNPDGTPNDGPDEPILQSPVIKLSIEDFEASSADAYGVPVAMGGWECGLRITVPWGVQIHNASFFTCQEAIRYERTSCKNYLSAINIQSCGIGLRVKAPNGAGRPSSIGVEGLHLTNFEMTQVRIGIDVTDGTVYHISNGHIHCDHNIGEPVALMGFLRVNNVRISNVTGWAVPKNVPTNFIVFDQCNTCGILNSQILRADVLPSDSSSQPIEANCILINGGHLMLVGNYIDPSGAGKDIIIHSSDVRKWPS